MYDKIERIFRIIMMIQAHPGIQVPRLASHFGVSARTIYRDLPIVTAVAPITNEGRGKGYRIISDFHLYPMNMTEEEQQAVSLLPSLIARDQWPAGFESAHAKIVASHLNERKQVRDFVDRFSEVIQYGEPAYQKNKSNFLSVIIDAIIHHHVLQTIYHTQYRDETTQRAIEPLHLIPRGHRFYLIAFCRLKQDIRMFRISRFEAVGKTGETFDKRSFNVAKYLQHTWSIERGSDIVHFRVKFDADIARYIKEEEMFVEPVMTDLDDGSLLFEVTVNSEKEFMQWIMQYGANAEVLEPAHVRDAMSEQLARWASRYQTE